MVSMVIHNWTQSTSRNEGAESRIRRIRARKEAIIELRVDLEVALDHPGLDEAVVPLAVHDVAELHVYEADGAFVATGAGPGI